MPVTQDNRHVSVTSPPGTDELLFHRMSGSDQLGRLSEYRLQLLSLSPSVDVANVLGQPIAVHLDLPDDKQRHFHGVVMRFAYVGRQHEFTLYEATVRSALWLLTRSVNFRIFQELSVLDIVKNVCGDAVYGGLVDLSGTHEALPYCVQYRESDFNFVCRLLESACIYFYFTHEASKHTMVLADSYGAHGKTPAYAKAPFSGQQLSQALDGESVSSWTVGGEIQASTFVLNDFDFEKASASSSGALRSAATVSAAFAQPAYEQFDYRAAITMQQPAVCWRVRGWKCCTVSASRSKPKPERAACSASKSIRATSTTASTW